MWGAAIGAGVGAAAGLYGGSRARKAAAAMRAQVNQAASGVETAGQGYNTFTNQQAHNWDPNARFQGQFGQNLGTHLGLNRPAGWADIANRQANLYGQQAAQQSAQLGRYANTIGSLNQSIDLQNDPSYQARMRAMGEAQDTIWGGRGGFLSGAAASARARAGADIAGQEWQNIYNRRANEIGQQHNANMQNIGQNFAAQQQALNAFQTPYSQLLGQQYNIRNQGQLGIRDSRIAANQMRAGGAAQWGSAQSGAAQMPFAGAAAGAAIGQQFWPQQRQ